MIGTTVKGYKVSRLLGQGGMANVYEAIVNERLGTKVAVKVLHPTLALEPTIRQRFEQEAMSMAQLNHPNIAKVVDFVEEDNMLAMVMEYLDGLSLREYIMKYGPVDPREALRIFGKVLDAFAYVHEKEIVHRDVKPSNIFLDIDGVPKVLDFGIAKLVSSSKLKTRTGVQIGTPLYMSPEQVKNPQSIDHRTDIYSLGVTLHHMLSGNPPYDQNTSEWEIQTKIVKEPLPNLAGMPPRLNEIIQQSTAKEPNERFQSCKEFKNAFRIKQLQNKPKPPKYQAQGMVDATLVDAPQELRSNQPKPIQLTPEPKKKAVSPKGRPKEKTSARQSPSLKRRASKSETNKWLSKRYRSFSRNYILGLILVIVGITFFVAEEVWDDFSSNQERQIFSIFMISGAFFLLISYISALRIIHKSWKLIEGSGASTTPGRAVGFLFIPLFNLYWVFVAYRSLTVEMNNYLLDNANTRIRIAKEGTAQNYCIMNLLMLVPAINILAIILNIFLWPATIKTIRKAAGTIADFQEKG
ncbi:MAG: serine/threonine-protein kinase [Bacteroidota bacterium]